MKAVVLQERGGLAVEEVTRAGLERSTDALVRVTTAAVCGSDVHIRHGVIPGVPPGTIMGHEFVGVVDAVGEDVTRFRRGDRVAAPAAIWCGLCPACRRGEVQNCEKGQVWGGGEIFGRGLPGTQAEFVRVPRADLVLTPIPDSVPDERAVFVGDMLSTGYHAAHEGGIKAGDAVAVYGCGPVGLSALVSAWQFGPRQVFAVDMLDNRLAAAEAYGAVPIDARQGDPAGQIRAATAGEGVDVALEAIGHPDSFAGAVRSVRRGGSVSVVGLFPGAVEFPLNDLVFYGLNVSMGLGNLSRMPQLMGLVEEGRIDPGPLATHRFALEDAVEAYELFETRKDECLKVLLQPGTVA